MPTPVAAYSPSDTDISGSAAAPVAVLTPRKATRPSVAPLGALSRVRGGTYSPTVDVIHFVDGSSARTDLIRLNPNIDGYSLDFAGISPRQLSHYREELWPEAPILTAVHYEEITTVLANSFPQLSTAELSRRLREAGYPLGNAEIREHEAIAATQAVIWWFTNGLELDVRRLDLPVLAHSRIGEHPSARRLDPEAAGTFSWRSLVPAGESAYLEFEYAGRPQLRSFDLVQASRSSQRDLEIHLESSSDGRHWRKVSGSSSRPSSRPGHRVHRGLGVGATISMAGATTGEQGHRHYRLVATGPDDRDTLVDLRDIHLETADRTRFRNSDRIAYLYDHLLATATGSHPKLQHAFGDNDHDAATGRVISFRRPGGPRVERELAAAGVQARFLIGSRTPTGPAEFTPVVSLTASRTPSVKPRAFAFAALGSI